MSDKSKLQLKAIMNELSEASCTTLSKVNGRKPTQQDVIDYLQDELTKGAENIDELLKESNQEAEQVNAETPAHFEDELYLPRIKEVLYDLHQLREKMMRLSSADFEDMDNATIRSIFRRCRLDLRAFETNMELWLSTHDLYDIDNIGGQGHD